MSETSGTKLHGLLLIVGSLLTILGELLLPGGTSARVSELVGSSFRTHLTSSVGTIGLLLVSAGMLGFWEHPRPRAGASAYRTSDALVRIGVLTLILGFAGWMLTKGLNHIIDHVVRHEGAPMDDLARGEAARIVRDGVAIVAGYLVFLGTAALGWGLWRTVSSGYYKKLALVMALIGSVGWLVALTANHTHSLILILMVAFANLPVTYCYVSLGVGLYKGTLRTEAT